MNSTDFSRYVANKYGTSYKDSMAWTRAVVESIGDVLISGEDIVFTNFGTFRTRVSGPKCGRNKYTGEAINIPERRRIKFVPSPNLQLMINDQFELDSGVNQATTVRMADIGYTEDEDVDNDIKEET